MKSSVVKFCASKNSTLFPLAAKLGERLSTEESLAVQAGALVEALCPQADDPALCEAVLSVHWAVIALAMYPTFIEPNSVCGSLGACQAMREWTCEDCQNGIAALGDIIVEAIPDIIEFLKVSQKYVGMG